MFVFVVFAAVKNLEAARQAPCGSEVAIATRGEALASLPVEKAAFVSHEQNFAAAKTVFFLVGLLPNN